MAKSKVAVILAGCGHLDGAEINESVMTLLALRLEGFEPEIFGLDKPLADVIDHVRREPSPNSESRMGITEAARIARGQIRPVAQLDVDAFAALAMPGGFGVAKNLCNFASNGSKATVDPDVERIVGAFLDRKKPILAVCISPAVVALVAAKKQLKLDLTVGDRANDASKALGELGHRMISAGPGDCVVDANARVVSTPFFMSEITIDQAWPGIQKSVRQVAEWTR